MARIDNPSLREMADALRAAFAARLAAGEDEQSLADEAGLSLATGTPTHVGPERLPERDSMIGRLEAQLELLKSEGPFTANAFRVWKADPELLAALGGALVRVERRSWSWGHCCTSTCRHASHSPFEEGDTITLLCQIIGEDEDGYTVIRLQDDRLLYFKRTDRGHYAPHIVFSF